MNNVRRFFGTTLVYFVGNVLSKLVSFFLLPLYTNRIPPDQYGSYDLVLSFLNLIAPIAFFQIWDGMFRRSFDFQEDEDKYDVISNAYVVSIAGGVIYFFLFGIVQLIYGFDHFGWAAIYGFFFSLHYLYNYICRVFLKNKLLVGTGLINTIITAGLNIILIVVFDFGVESLYISPALGTLIQIILIEWNIKSIKHFRAKAVNKTEITWMLKFSIPLCVASLSYWLLSGFTKVIITSMLGNYENGLYAVANKFGTIIALLVTIVQYAWNEMAYLMAGDKNRTQSYNICIDIMLKCVVSGGATLCILVKGIFPYLIDVQYSEGIWIVPATIIGVMFNSMAGFIGTLFMAENNTKEIMKSTLISAGVNIVLCIVLTKLFGLHGATIALGMAFLHLLIIRLIQAVRKFNLNINMRKYLPIILVLILSIVEYYLIDNLAVDVLMVSVIVCLFLFSIRSYIKIIVAGLKAKSSR